jgi:type IV secretion system protein VirD4
MSVHGTARFATRGELRDAGLLRSRPAGEFTEGLMVGWWFGDKYDFEPIEYDGDLHQLIAGGTGGGKFTTAIAPMLLGSSLAERTVVVVDPKGEIAKLAGPYFETPFASQQTVHLLDPWDQCGTGQTAALNVLEQITADNLNYVDDARALADAMIIPSGGENTHWDNAARNFLTAILLYVALSPKEKDNRDLMRVRDLVSMTWAMPKAYTGPKRPTLSALLFELIESDLADGAVKRGVSSIFNREDKERSGIISSIDRDTSWMDSPQMAKVLRGKSLDLKEAALGGHKYFIVLPPDFFMTHRAWLRLMVTAFAKAFKRSLPEAGQPPHARWRHIVIDEFANLGEMSFIVNDIAVSRGFDVKYHLAIQDLSQLARVYKHGWESFINNSFQRFFAISDLFTADYVSRMLGASTAHSVSTSRGSSGSRSLSYSASDSSNQSRTTGILPIGGTRSSGTGEGYSRGYSETSGWSNSESISPIQRSLRTPDEVRRLPQQSEFLFFRGMHPIECWRPPYWDVFPSLPAFSLKEVLGTTGRKPKNDAERLYFTEWRARSPLLQPEARPARVAPLPPPISIEPQPLDYRIKLALGFAAILLLFFVFRPSIFFRPSPPQEPVIAVAPPEPVIAVAPPAPVTAPALPSPSPQPAPVRTRAPVPNISAIDDMARGAGTRDYLLTFVQVNINLCAPGQGEKERQLIGYLFFRARDKSDFNRSSDPSRAKLLAQYRALFEMYARKPNWSRSDREEILELMLRSTHDNFATGTAGEAIDAAINRFYQGGGCPFDTVAENEYLPPVYADAKSLAAQR